MKKTAQGRVENLLRHIRHVQDNCLVLGMKMIEAGEEELGRILIANGQVHDNSKFKGVEWDSLSDTSEPEAYLSRAISQHNRTNPHHPEYWGGIHNMPEIYVAEMVCDWKARSSEFGTDLRAWITDKAAPRFKFALNVDPVGIKITKFVDLLLEQAFQN